MMRLIECFCLLLPILKVFLGTSLSFDDRFDLSEAETIAALGEPLLDVLFLWCNRIAGLAAQISLWRDIAD